MKRDPLPKVLMYHGICSETSLSPQSREVGAELYDVTVEDFRSQMTWLKSRGYTTSLEDPSDKKIIITFDDGEMNVFQEAFPILQELGFKAAFFIIVKRIGKSGYMGWKEVRQLMDAGMSIGSHGLTHSILTSLLDSQVEEELKGSKRTLEINLGRAIEELSIPRGFCNDRIISMARQIGYQRVYVSDKPCSLKADCMARAAVKRNWSLKRFQQMIDNQRPWSEIGTGVLKKASKMVLREEGYNFVRGMVLRMIM